MEAKVAAEFVAVVAAAVPAMGAEAAAQGASQQAHTVAITLTFRLLHERMSPRPRHAKFHIQGRSDDLQRSANRQQARSQREACAHLARSHTRTHPREAHRTKRMSQSWISQPQRSEPDVPGCAHCQEL